MSTSIAVILSLLGWFALTSTNGIRPYVFVASVLAVMVSAYRAWLKERNAAEGLRGRPDVTLECEADTLNPGTFKFRVQNSNDHVAVNVTVLPIRFTIPEVVRQSWRETRDAFGHSVEIPNEWIVQFDEIQSLVKGYPKHINYSIDSVGALQRQDLGYVLSGMEEEFFVMSFTVILRFSDLAEPKRVWHSVYAGTYDIAAKVLSLHHIQIRQTP
jgi:hypothetical protein